MYVKGLEFDRRGISYWLCNFYNDSFSGNPVSSYVTLLSSMRQDEVNQVMITCWV